MSNSSIWPIDRTLSSATTLGQSGHERDGYKRVLRIPQSSCITRVSPVDCLVSYAGHTFGWGVLPLRRDAVIVFYTPKRLGCRLFSVIFRILLVCVWGAFLPLYSDAVDVFCSSSQLGYLRTEVKHRFLRFLCDTPRATQRTQPLFERDNYLLSPYKLNLDPVHCFHFLLLDPLYHCISNMKVSKINEGIIIKKTSSKYFNIVW